MSDNKRAYQLTRDRFGEAQHSQQSYFVRVPSGVKPEDMEDPAFFSAVAPLCRPSGRIFVEADDGLWLADAYIVSCGTNYVHVRVLQVWNMAEWKAPATPTPAPTGYKVEWGGRHHKWRVVREADAAVVHKEAASETDAHAWLNEHLKALAR